MFGRKGLSESTLRRTRFRMDLSLNITRKRRADEEPVWRYGWSDSPSTRNRNILNSKVAVIAKKDVVAAALAANQLSEDCATISSDSEEQTERRPIDRHALSMILLKLRVEKMTPVGIGSSSLEHKSAAFILQI